LPRSPEYSTPASGSAARVVATSMVTLLAPGAVEATGVSTPFTSPAQPEAKLLTIAAAKSRLAAGLGRFLRLIGMTGDPGWRDAQTMLVRRPPRQ
jgi:hypothetical protein